MNIESFNNSRLEESLSLINFQPTQKAPPPPSPNHDLVSPENPELVDSSFPVELSITLNGKMGQLDFEVN